MKFGEFNLAFWSTNLEEKQHIAILIYISCNSDHKSIGIRYYKSILYDGSSPRILMLL